MRPSRPKPADRRKQDVPAEIVSDILGTIRGAFYPDSYQDKEALKTWLQDSHFVRQRVVLWPAAWLTKRGVTLSGDRYKQLLLSIIQDVKRHGQTAVVKYWPGYLAHCVQEHFRHHGDEIYEEAKALRTKLESTLWAIDPSRRSGSPDPVEALAQAHAVLASRRPSSRASRTAPPSQLSLL